MLAPPHDLSTLVLLPGMDGSGELFAPLLKELPAWLETRVVRYPSQPMRYPELLDVVIRALPTDRPYCLLAESFSGPLGIEVAAQAPPQLKKLVLCCTFARNPRPALATLVPLLQFVPFSAMPLSFLGRALMGGEFDAGLQAMLTKAMAQVPSDALRARLRSVREVDKTSCLPRIAVPTLYLQAASDQLVPKQASEVLLAQVQNLKVALLAGPHFLLQTNPANAARTLESFLEGKQS
ncbi:alpha/beta fold hydrolase [Hydrogenophaga sp. XSHU_21]